MLTLHRYAISFTEDGPPVFPLDTPGFTITDDDNTLLLRATLAVLNTGIPLGVSDQLFVPASDRLSVAGNGSSQLVIEAVGPFRFFTLQTVFIDFLRMVSFTSDDQASFITRNISLIVEEHPIGEAPSDPALIPLSVLPVNDQPVLVVPQTTEEVLDSYLPQEERNSGFNASFLLADTDVVDVDRLSPISSDFVGLAITSSENGNVGIWEYWNGTWMAFPLELSECDPLFIRPEVRVRFSPSPSQLKQDGRAVITYRAWDGSGSSLQCEDEMLQLSAGEQ